MSLDLIASQLSISFPKLKLVRDEGALEVTSGKAKLLSVYDNDGDWVVGAPNSGAHVHRDSWTEAADVVESLLRGEARWAAEFRGDVQAAAWMEVWDEGSYLIQERAIYLQPLDPDEWQLAPGEYWRVDRTEYRTRLGRFKLHTFSVEGIEPLGWSEKDCDDFLTSLGPPPDGLKWTMAPTPRLILVAPRGWRRVQTDEEKPSFVDLAPPEGGIALRVHHYFRDREESILPEGEPMPRPVDVEFETDAASEESNGWACDRWKLLFPADGYEMLAMLELYHLPGEGPDPAPIRHRLDRHIRECRHWPSAQSPAADSE